jgi:hypothetical protein
MMDDDDILAPFAAHRYGEDQTYDIAAEDRLYRVKTFDLAQCRAALKIPRLQKTVVAAILRRMKRLEKEA